MSTTEFLMSRNQELREQRAALNSELDKRNENTKVWIQAETQTRAYANRLQAALEKIIEGRFHIGNDKDGNVYGPPDGVMCRKIAEEALKGTS